MATISFPDLPTSFTPEQVATALGVLGIPCEAVKSAELGVRFVTVTRIVKQAQAFHEVKTEIPIRRSETTEGDTASAG